MKPFISLIVSLAALALFSGCKTPTPPATTAHHDTYVLVHGAWGGGWDWRHVDELLTADGNRVYRVTLTGQGERSHLTNTNIDLDTHIQDVVNTILWENLHDVILVGHSYGGMVVTGVANRVPDRIKCVVYLDAILPENGESVMTAMPPRRLPLKIQDGYILPYWVPPSTPPPHDVPMSEKCFTQTLELTNPTTVPGIYVLAVDPGKAPDQDDFYKFYLRAKARSWPAWIIESDHNVQRSHPREISRLIEQAAAQPSSHP